MDLTKHCILLNGENKTHQITDISRQGNLMSVKFSNSTKAYAYKAERVEWLRNPTPLTIDENVCVTICGRVIKDVSAIWAFGSEGRYKWFTVQFSSGLMRQHSASEVNVGFIHGISKGWNVFEYIRQCAGINSLGASVTSPDGDNRTQEHQGILAKIYAQINRIEPSSAAVPYLSPAEGIATHKFGTPIFPFGCNASQMKAVTAALNNQISVIQGPPGTGKTQTILNIISNLLVKENSILVVSNNNSATQNVADKLAKNGLDFLVAPLGSKENREHFIANQPQVNPEVHSWHKSWLDGKQEFTKVEATLKSLDTVFNSQERLAAARQELAEVEVEKKHFESEHSISVPRFVDGISSRSILRDLQQLNALADASNEKPHNWLQRLKSNINRYALRMRLRYLLKVVPDLSPANLPNLITLLEATFYIRRLSELNSEITALEAQLAKFDTDTLINSLTSHSMELLKARLSARHHPGSRPTFASTKELYNNGSDVIKHYPVVLSTTFSSKFNFHPDTLFDYVIMDEASQVSIDTALLALTCARNAVIVGDTMQLPNVITDSDRQKLEAINTSMGCPAEAYDVSRHSFLSSILAALPQVPVTLLREHYRCHPDIINFCNQKFYGGNLIIMTERQPNDKPLSALITSPGNHTRGCYNQREIDAVKLELIPKLASTDTASIGIIAPYNRQVDEFRAQLPDFEVATVHKYQGREKDTIIMSVTDDIISDFADDANLLNVAVSRAKRRFCLVVTGNPQSRQGNIHDLIAYIRYNHGTISHSRIRSIYDYLFTHINLNRATTSSQKSTHHALTSTFSNFESENLTYDLIESIRTTEPRLSHIKAISHYPLRALLADVSLLSDTEAAYVLHPSTHIDLLIINRVTKEPLLAIVIDGYTYHSPNTDQFRRDRLKDHILSLYSIPILRLSTVGHSERQRITAALLAQQ